jgi:5'-AMP-activated protein kinase regulatory beta subunit
MQQQQQNQNNDLSSVRSTVSEVATVNFTGTAEAVVPTVFKWEHGGRHVYITGTFNNWERQIPMHRSGNDFTYVHNLPKGKHAYKFIVDDEWRFAPDQPTIADVEGRINNFIDITEFVPYTGDDHFFEKSKERKIPDEEFRQVVPDLDDYTKE